jgi:hypothetical protein
LIGNPLTPVSSFLTARSFLCAFLRADLSLPPLS